MSSHDAIHPMDLILPQSSAFYVMRQSVAWVKGVELNSNQETWVPAIAVFHPYVSKMDLPLFRTSTNGLACGNNLEEAVLHGLCEVVERNDSVLRPKVNAKRYRGHRGPLLRKGEGPGGEIHLQGH